MDNTNYNENNENEINEIIEKTEKILITNFIFKNKLDKYVWDHLPIDEEDKIKILNEIIEEVNDSVVDTTASEANLLTVDLIESQISSFAGVSAENPDQMPTADNPYIITFANPDDVGELTIVYPQSIIENQWSYNYDFFIGDDELASLPEQLDPNDISSIITIRAKAQNTWNKL